MVLGILSAVALATSGSAPSRGDAGLQSVVLALHNQERAAVGAPALLWSARLARDARTWAERLAASGVFQHDGANTSEGENLWMGTRGAFRLEDMVSGWVNEKAQFRRVRSWQANFHRVGHYTQMIWARTSAVGCALAQSARYEYLVCRYDPPGNVWNESPYDATRLAANRRIVRSGS